MEIKIALRVHPFSHTPGVTCLIPGSSWQIEIFPTLLRLEKKPGKKMEYPLSLRGPMRDFTVVQDLEKRVIRVFGHTPEGYIRYEIHARSNGIFLFFNKAPLEQKKEVQLIKEKIRIPPSSQERLSLGVHRSQEWEKMRRARDLKEIFPIWLKLAAWTLPSEIVNKGTGLLLQPCHQAIVQNERIRVVPSFLNLFDAAFYDMLTPRLFDTEYQGITPTNENLSEKQAPLFLLTEGARLIRSLFIQEKGNDLALLPCLPPEFHAGRCTGLTLSDGTVVDLEWSKALIRRVTIRAASDRSLLLNLQKPIDAFRLRSTKRDRGQRFNISHPIELRAGKTLTLDRFTK